ncbi:IPT/TIG domain-containing protein [Pedobacter sp. 22163]|uniref:IPT/TIG domain-containing protein n=1 Tax=Pedobacter sp. 22163 TaxID=3453883 RepID=UPI003F845F48
MKPLRFAMLFVSIAFALLYYGCKKDEPLPGPVKEVIIADIETVSATAFQDGGVTFVGKVNKIPANVRTYGFIISRDSLFTKNPQFYPLNRPIAVGEFKTDVNNFGIQKDSVYYLTTYIVAESGYKLFNVKKFVSNGAKQIKIDSIYPSKALIGDTLTLKGKYFTGHNLSVKFGDRPGGWVSVSDSIIKITVPPDLGSFNPVITLNEGVKTDTLSQVFALYTPRIDEYTTLGTFRDTVVIKGNYFSRFLNGNQVSFGNIKATVVSYSKQQLKVIVPDDIEFSKTLISLKAQVQTVATSTPFVIRKPELLIVPQSGNVNDVVMVEGKNFHPVLNKNQLSFEGNAATLNTGNTAKFTLNIPNGPYPKRTARVVLKLLDYEIVYPINFQVLNKWIMVSNQVPFDGYTNSGSFTINGTSYVIASAKGVFNVKKYVWKFNPSDFSWEKSEIPFAFTSGQVTVAGNKAYLYCAQDLNNFWEYDPASNHWAQKATYMAGIRQSGVIVSAGQYIYFGMGLAPQPFSNFLPNSNFYRYSIASNTWEKETDYPTEFGNNERVFPSAFVVDEKIYFGCGATNTGMFQFHSYTPATKTWAKLANFPDARLYATTFVYQNQGYIAKGHTVQGALTADVYKYDIAANAWIKMPDKIGTPALDRGIERGYSFVNNGKAYVGGSNGSEDTYQLFMAEGSSL